METIQTRSPEETLEFAAKFAQRLRPGDVVALTGELGAGKTLLTRGICCALGFGGDVNSASFVRLHRYDIRPRIDELTNRRIDELTIHHADFYLIRDRDEAMDLGLDELYGGNEIVIIEWAQRFPDMVPDGSWWIEIEWIEGEESERTILIKNPRPETL